MKPDFVLYCKSYRNDLFRVRRLAESIKRFNADRIPFFISVPKADLSLFQEHVGHACERIVSDEDIIQSCPTISLDDFQSLPGGISQQVVKSEFWRLGVATAYACLDSDACFIRPFFRHEFVNPNGNIYTILDEGHDILDLALITRRPMIIENFVAAARGFQELFDRQGPHYSFGPNPYIWHADVWRSLDTEYLQPRDMNIVDAIIQNPLEANWYGEALLKFEAIPLHPRQSFFKVYHYAWQFDRDRRAGVTQDQLAKLYCGVIYQSAWERQMDWPREAGTFGSRVSRRLRRLLGRI